MLKVTIVGAGGYVFPVRLCVDIVAMRALRDCRICLYDIHEGRLKATQGRIERLIEQHELPTIVDATTDREKALKNADFVIVAFQVGSIEAYKFDVEIPRKYGLDQCVGDTLGPGGVFRGLRSIAAFREICHTMHEVCPDALILQYANPMAINCWAINNMGIKVVGLCHSVQGTTKMLAHRAGLPYDECHFKCYGINHQAWITEFKHRGEEVYPHIREVMLRQNPSPLSLDGAQANGQGSSQVFEQRGLDHQIEDEHYYHERVRTEILRHFGYFQTESSHHAGEYLPWFRKDKETIDAYIARRWDYYQISCAHHQAGHNTDAYLEKLITDEPMLSEEYGARIINAMTTGEPAVVYGNVPNFGAPGSSRSMTQSHLIPNLPQPACVEVACLVDRNGIQPTAPGPLPPQCAAINRTNINVQELAVLGGMTGDRDAVHQAIALDPLTGALMTLPQIRSMVNEMFEAEQEWLPQFASRRTQVAVSA
ncbi:MAG: alpha-galactosidase [Armatimonadota bacterium]|nr:alpha-galactosidase [Armatimonadota bacterium]